MKTCLDCNQTKDLSFFHLDPSRRDGRYVYCKECCSIRRKRIYQKYKAKQLAQTSAYAKANPQKRAGYISKQQKQNPGKWAAYTAERRAYKLQATPKWLSETQVKEIENLYILAAELSWLSEGGLHVDHIWPLKGKDFSGLHVPWNLQILPAKLNCSKKNSRPDEGL